MTRKRKTTARGYGSRHQRLRRTWAPSVAAGRVDCARCGQRIQPGDDWDLGHDDHDRTKYSGPEHQSCNRGAASQPKSPRPRRVSSW